ncbi:CKLF-like MARVEL transmembrane domain-containing protein 1 isoform X1 [Ochotona princeps]|uniref:CKLF-like MARVEL transmembrane domain-containing protein 1 isoform X1 n=1 Tax=Ochotona princeps TaxID=9978 RepID=UPI0027148D38|nr:CKLF-like MARVEL transmembrane domain-containing protein 1 isoform X1 [Ochotona princeps]
MDPENTSDELSSSSPDDFQYPETPEPVAPSTRDATLIHPTPETSAAHPTRKAASHPPRRAFSVYGKTSPQPYRVVHPVPPAPSEPAQRSPAPSAISMQHPVRPAPSAGSMRRPVRPAPSGSMHRPVRPAPPAGSMRRPVRPAPAIPQVPPRQRTDNKANPEASTESQYVWLAAYQGSKKEIQKRAKGRDKVPHKLTDSFKKFFFSPTGILKLLRMGVITAAAICFFEANAPESYIAITILEAFIVTFFILIYLLSLQYLLTYIHWPLLDLINSIISALFLSMVGLLVMEEKRRRHLLFIGGILCVTAAVLCVIDALMVTKRTRDDIKRLLGAKKATQHTLHKAPHPNTRARQSDGQHLLLSGPRRTRAQSSVTIRSHL